MNNNTGFDYSSSNKGTGFNDNQPVSSSESPSADCAWEEEGVVVMKEEEQGALPLPILLGERKTTMRQRSRASRSEKTLPACCQGEEYHSTDDNGDDDCSDCTPRSESEGGGGRGLTTMIITRPKGGKRSLCMDWEEMKACRDLGFELEHQLTFDAPMPTLFSPSAPSSPAAGWRISGPGDDPREVKARLKLWAHAVAMASTSGRLRRG